MSFLRMFLTADSEFAIENLPKPKGKPEIDASETGKYRTTLLNDLAKK